MESINLLRLPQVTQGIQTSSGTPTYQDAKEMALATAPAALDRPV